MIRDETVSGYLYHDDSGMITMKEECWFNGTGNATLLNSEMDLEESSLTSFRIGGGFGPRRENSARKSVCFSHAFFFSLLLITLID